MRYDEFQHELMNNPIYNAREYEVFVSRDGEKRVIVGVHSLLCDRGYHNSISGKLQSVERNMRLRRTSRLSQACASP